MSRLSDRTHWDAVHRRAASGSGGGRSPRGGTAARIARRLLPARLVEYMTPYDQHLLWRVLFRKHLGGYRGGRALEVGSAPGTFIARFCETYGGVPFGVEYSDVGVAVNRETFRTHGFDPGNVIHADFLSDGFHRGRTGLFDIVISRGFIEHFTDVPAVVERHISLLAPGGYLVVTVPNLRGVNKFLTRVLNPRLLPLHNLEIMRLEAFRALFERDAMQTLHCGYYGTFTFYLFYTDPGSWLRLPLRAAQRLQPILNLAFHLLLGDRGAESRALSPSLVYIGRKDPGHRGSPCPA